MPVEKAAERGEYGGERYEKIEFQRKVANIYSQLQENNWKVNLIEYKKHNFNLFRPYTFLIVLLLIVGTSFSLPIFGNF